MDQSSLVVTRKMINWDAAATAACAAVAKAGSLNVKINVAIVDASGIAMAFLRMPGAPLHSISIAEDKAYTAASFGLDTAQWHEALSNHSHAVGDGLLRRPRFVAFGGGLPILHEGEIIGAIGVSGATEEQDRECALAGIAAIT